MASLFDILHEIKMNFCQDGSYTYSIETCLFFFFRASSSPNFGWENLVFREHYPFFLCLFFPLLFLSHLYFSFFVPLFPFSSPILSLFSSFLPSNIYQILYISGTVVIKMENELYIIIEFCPKL